MPDARLEVAVVGGGIVGVIAALGFLHRGMQVTVYEKQDELQELGAAFAFTGVARECMQRLDPRILKALETLANPNPFPNDRYWDGYNPKTKEAAQHQDALLFEVSSSDLKFWGCLRSQLLKAIADLLPGGAIKFGKQLDTYRDDPGSRVRLHFTDGTIAEADVVIGCDGLFSKTRQLLLGRDSDAATPRYTHKVAYRAVLPIADTIAALGHDKANNHCAQMGPDAHVLSYPVANWTLSNVVVFLLDPDPWPEVDKTTAPSTRAQVEEALKDWSPSVRELVSKFPTTLSKWGLYDMAQHPAHTYAIGRVCIAGDAAHASSPFHGAGAGMGVEDVLVLATVLEEAMSRLSDGTVMDKTHVVSAALQAYTNIRYERSQWLVRSSRDVGELYMWRYPEAGRDPEKCKAEFETRTRKIWDFDVGMMVTEAQRKCESLE